MSTERELRLGKGRLRVPLSPDTVILCDNSEQAQRLARALADTGGRRLDGTDTARGTVADAIARKVSRDRIESVVAALQLPEDILDWRLRDCSTLRRLIASCLLAVLEEARPIIIDTTHVAASPFDVAHVFALVRRLRQACAAEVVVIIADPAFISSAGGHLVVVSDDAVVESGPVGDVLAQPASATLLRRLEATPIANPLAMQGRRVQRLATRPVNYAHTQVIALPTQDSVALAGGEEPTEV